MQIRLLQYSRRMEALISAHYIVADLQMIRVHTCTGDAKFWMRADSSDEHGNSR